MLLIATVGGKHEPIIKPIVDLKADMVRFIVTKRTAEDVPSIVEKVQEELPWFGPSNYQVERAVDPNDLKACVHAARKLSPVVSEWRARGEEYHVYVNITGGTKAMAAGLALVAQRWPCRFVYVGGEKREHDGAGNVISGYEELLDWVNPWDELGYQVREDAVLLFNGGNYAAAAELLGRSLIQVPADRRGELATLRALAEAYSDWERFRHDAAANTLKKVRANINDLRYLFGIDAGEELAETIRIHMEWLGKLNKRKASRELVLDLLANARRRASEERYDDAVARLYRAVEAWAQYILQTEYNTITKSVEPEQVPETLRGRWWVDSSTEPKKIGLEEAYTLLMHHGNPLGHAFEELFRHDRRGRDALAARNLSIMAHGFEPVSPGQFHNFWYALFQLTNLDENDLPEFPTLELVH